ncbi:MAG: hypothetical protein E7570_07925 [Ruminococcaceae bacterium]|nr:hypothetical protein [Oscillospiraceae bacterium]
MKSDIIHVSSNGDGVAEAIKQTELVANFKSLSKKDSIHLLLLTEEMMGMMKALTGEQEADFWIDDENNDFRLHLKAETSMNAEMRRNLLSASTSGENIAAKGVMGKIRDLFSRILEPGESPVPAEYATGWSSSNLSTAEAAAVAKNYSPMLVNVWSFNRYKASRENAEEWDELEKSIVANIADEVEIGIAEGTVEMIVYKKV